MLERGWRVLAIDAEPAAIERLSARVPPGAHDRLETQVAQFEDARWPEADLVNASFSLPFCAPDRFDEVWARVRAGIAPGGRFAGQLFGDRDEWASSKDLVFLPRARVEAMLDGLELERFDELEEDGTTALGEAKHWHVFHIVARRPADDELVAGVDAGRHVGHRDLRPRRARGRTRSGSRATLQAGFNRGH